MSRTDKLTSRAYSSSSNIADFDNLRQNFEEHAGHHVILPKRNVSRNAGLIERLFSGVAYPTALRMRGSVIPRIFIPVLFYGLWGAFVAALRDWLDTNHNVQFEFTGSTVLALSIVIGMILGFRTNTAYERFTAGRQVICDITANLRNLKRILSDSRQFPHNNIDSCIRALHLLPAFLIAVKSRLRESYGRQPHDDLNDVIHTIERNITSDIRRIPSVILDQIYAFTSVVPKAEGYVAALSTSFTNLERISNTPIPSAYDIHLNQVTALYLIIFPLQMTDYWWGIPATMFAAFTLLGVEGIGEEIENPFGYDWNDLPLDAYVADFIMEIEYAVSCVTQGHKAGTMKIEGNSSADTVLVDVK